MVAFMDETTTHRWERISKVWAPKNEPIYLDLNKERGHNVTVIGAVCSHWAGEEFQYTLADCTNSINVKIFIKHIAPLVPPEGGYMVLDNHAAHTSDKVINFAWSECKLRFLFLPPCASELNPIECK
jgi:hypothetical protein